MNFKVNRCNSGYIMFERRIQNSPYYFWMSAAEFHRFMNNMNDIHHHLGVQSTPPADLCADGETITTMKEEGKSFYSECGNAPEVLRKDITEKLFGCSYCKRMYSRKHDAKRHEMKIHHTQTLAGEKPLMSLP